LNVEKGKVMLEYYKTLIALRKEYPALNNHDRNSISAEVIESLQILVLERNYQDQKISVMMNFSNDHEQINLHDSGDWQMIFNSADSKWNGPGISGTGIQPQSVIIYLHV
jgi:maltooligosyltrehalose trehalohydrolase